MHTANTMIQISETTKTKCNINLAIPRSHSITSSDNKASDPPCKKISARFIASFHICILWFTF